jgi:hypothetical protein
MALLTVRNAVGFTKPPRGPALWFRDDMSVRLYAAKASPTTMGNSTTQTTLASFTVPAFAFSGGGVRGVVSGTISAGSTTTVTVRSKLVISGTTALVAQSSAIPLTASTSPRDFLSGVLVLGTTNSTALISHNETVLSAPSAFLTAPAVYTGTGYTRSIVPNSTAQSTLSFTLQFGHASTAISGNVSQGTLETLA